MDEVRNCCLRLLPAWICKEDVQTNVLFLSDQCYAHGLTELAMVTGQGHASAQSILVAFIEAFGNATQPFSTCPMAFLLGFLGAGV